jgi:aryl-alcohol dehydrogenase-like predicted oxidoreductase
VADPGHVAVGTWSGGRFMRFGEAIDDERLTALLRPGDGIDTVLTADTYGSGEADELLGRALRGIQRESYCLVGAVGHDFYEGEREGSKGFPRFTDPRLRGAEQYASYLRMATERSLERVGVDRFDLLLLHNPDRIGYTSPAVWEGMAALRDAGLTRMLGVAPGPANGFTLDLIDCLERFGELVDWAMVILNPLEPWPGELVLPAAQRYGVDLITRVVDYGGLFWDDVRPGHAFAQHDHRAFRPDGWVQTTMQLACQWNLAHYRVRCTVPTLIEEPDAEKPIEAKRAELAGVPRELVLSDDELAEIRALGDNTGSMALKGASPQFEGEPQADRWPMTSELRELAARWAIEPERELSHVT